MDIWQVVREFGLPLAILAFFVGAIVTGTLVAGRELKAKDAEADERLAYVEARRAEEREGRLKAEEQLASVTISTTESIRAMSGLLSDIEKEVIRGSPRRPPR